MYKLENARILVELLDIEPLCIRESAYGTVDIWLGEEEVIPGLSRYKDKIELVGSEFALTKVGGLNGPWKYDDFDGYYYLYLK